MSTEGILSSALNEERDAIRYSVSAALAKAFPDMAILETDDRAFDIEEFWRKAQCKLRPIEGQHSQFKRYWNPKHKQSGYFGENSWREVEWKARSFRS